MKLILIVLLHAVLRRRAVQNVFPLYGLQLV